jgi:uncharacterized protein (TIGR03790 family)
LRTLQLVAPERRTWRAESCAFRRARVVLAARAMRLRLPSLLVLLVIARVAAGCSDSSDAVTEPPGDGADAGTAGPSGPAVEAGADAAPAPPLVLFPRTGLEPDELAVVVNDADPLSVAVADYYVKARNIPAANVQHVTIPGITASTLSEADFAPLKTKLDAALAGTKVQALLLTWTKPYAVGNMSITSAFAMGYRAIANGNTCNDPASQALSPYAKQRTSTRPFTDLGFRPAMTLPATTLEEAKAIVDRGVASDGTSPKGTAYLMDTTDQTRSARCIVNPTYGYTNECQHLIDQWDSAGTGVDASAITKANSITGKKDVLFYVQGLASVPDLKTNTYLPGAVADHLTSFGGQIPTSGQMSAFEFLRAGATGSYGTVVEPCAFQQKFPDPSVLVPQYFGGATLVEAYWKSVLWPAEGIFLGEPLARPFGTGFTSRFGGGTLTIETTAMIPNVDYLIEAADAEAGPFTTVLDALTTKKVTRATFTVPQATRRAYRFRAAK